MSNNKSKTGLGRGLDSLIPKDINTAALLSQDETIRNIPLNQIIAKDDQPRVQFDETALDELAASIKRHGIIQPLIVTKVEQNKYSIIAGERRWRAAKKAGLKTVPTVVKTLEALEQLEIALIENVQRVDLSPLEQAVSIEKLHQQFGMSYADIAARLGKATTTIKNIVRLLQLPEKSREALRDQKISEGHARALLSLKDDEAHHYELLKNIIDKKWSVRQAEQYVVARKKKLPKSDEDVKKHMAATTPETRQLSRKLKTPVSLRRSAKGGRIEIKFKDDKQLNNLLRKLGSETSD